MTAVENLAPWASLLAAALSIGYVVLREHRYRTDAAADGSGDATSLADAVAEYDGTLVTAVTFFTVAGIVHLTVDVSAYVPPVALWVAIAGTVVLVAVGEAAGYDEE